ncbi:DNA-binding domain-containing protein [Sphingomonas arenae]|uniref:HvfC/BufC N-terminal domain-containing protein n=1 Tax=Sphingomonas arenae TaxID=2812555 RepID=UPI001967A52B|nr:DNA-binding domain-containing protein [Sphingomonas arenae]
MSDHLAFQKEFAAAIGEPVRGALAVYRNTVIAGCVEALRANYPYCAALLGEDAFLALAVDYAEQRPPRTPVLALYGARFADWLEDQPVAAQLPYLSDVARFERLHLECLFAPDAEPLAMTDLANVTDWDALKLRLHPATRFDWATRPAMTIWLAHEDGPSGEDIALEWRAEGALFTRPRLRVSGLLIDRAMHRMLFGIRLGESVGAAALATAALYPDADPGACLATLVDAGAFAALA